MFCIRTSGGRMVAVIVAIVVRRGGRCLVQNQENWENGQARWNYIYTKGAGKGRNWGKMTLNAVNSKKKNLTRTTDDGFAGMFWTANEVFYYPFHSRSLNPYILRTTTHAPLDVRFTTAGQGEPRRWVQGSAGSYLRSLNLVKCSPVELIACFN